MRWLVSSHHAQPSGAFTHFIIYSRVVCTVLSTQLSHLGSPFFPLAKANNRWNQRLADESYHKDSAIESLYGVI